MIEWPSPHIVAGPAHAHGYKRKTLEIVHPWTSEKPEAIATEAAVGMTIRNAGRQAERLIAARSSVAERVEIRRPEAGHVQASAKRSPPGIAIPSRGDVHLKPSAAHLRLIGLKKPLVAYDTLPVTLVFERAGTIEIDVLVEEATP